MNVNFAEILAGLEKGLDTVNTLLPVAQAVGVPVELVSKVTNIASAVLETGQHVQVLVNEGTIEATSQDQDALKATLADIQARNDALDAYVDAH